jgi:ketosteroid isomerase-like protein
MRKTGVLMLSLMPAWSTGAATNVERQEEVRKAETAFAATMAKRDHAAFASFLADDAVFFGRQGVNRGKAAVAAAWKGFYQAKDAPFSWRPESVEVLEGGELGLSSGPVFDPAGKQVGTFNSVWRREKDGAWRVVFDKGCPPCDCSSRERPSNP